MDSPYPRWEPTILCVGLVCRDITVEVPTYPRPDSKVVTTGYREGLGGNACNVAVAIHKLGGEVELVSKILGKKGIYDELDTLGMFRSGMVVSKEEGHIGLSYVISTSSDNNRTILHSRMSEQMMPDEIPMMKFQHYWDSTQVSCLYLDGRFPYVAEVYAIEASQRKVPIVMDVERADRDKLNELLVLCTGIVVSGYHTLTEVEDTLYGGVNLFDKCSNLEWMVVTMGKDGAEMILRQDRKKRERIPPHVVDDVVDTTGAGDAFQAGLVYSMCKRRMQQQEKETDDNTFIPSRADLEFASFLAGENCRHLGAQNTLLADQCREAMTVAAIL